MITHKISTYRTISSVGLPTHSSKFRGVLGSDEHKKFIYDRVVENNKFGKFDPVLYRGSKAHVTEVMSYRETTWEKFKPLLLEIFVYDLSEFTYVHPSDIKRDLT